jgi:hypothetical protein
LFPSLQDISKEQKMFNTADLTMAFQNAFLSVNFPLSVS